jgi:hypothetical protein
MLRIDDFATPFAPGGCTLTLVKSGKIILHCSAFRIPLPLAVLERASRSSHVSWAAILEFRTTEVSR